MERENKKKIVKSLILICSGIVIGAVNGFFGGGGGMICVPILLALGLSNQKAHATAILTMLPISIASGIVYYTSGALNWTLLLWICIGSCVGGVLGALLLRKIPNRVLQFIFAILVIAVGVKMVI